MTESDDESGPTERSERWNLIGQFKGPIVVALKAERAINQSGRSIPKRDNVRSVTDKTGKTNKSEQSKALGIDLDVVARQRCAK